MTSKEIFAPGPLDVTFKKPGGTETIVWDASKLSIKFDKWEKGHLPLYKYTVRGVSQQVMGGLL